MKKLTLLLILILPASLKAESLADPEAVQVMLKDERLAPLKGFICMGALLHGIDHGGSCHGVGGRFEKAGRDWKAQRRHCIKTFPKMKEQCEWIGENIDKPLYKWGDDFKDYVGLKWEIFLGKLKRLFNGNGSACWQFKKVLGSLISCINANNVSLIELLANGKHPSERECKRALFNDITTLDLSTPNLSDQKFISQKLGCQKVFCKDSNVEQLKAIYSEGLNEGLNLYILKDPERFFSCDEHHEIECHDKLDDSIPI